MAFAALAGETADYTPVRPLRNRQSPHGRRAMTVRAAGWRYPHIAPVRQTFTDVTDCSRAVRGPDCWGSGWGAESSRHCTNQNLLEKQTCVVPVGCNTARIAGAIKLAVADARLTTSARGNGECRAGPQIDLRVSCRSPPNGGGKSQNRQNRRDRNDRASRRNRSRGSRRFGRFRSSL